MKARTISQTLYFPVSPQTFYESFLNSTVHEAMTGAHAHISDKIGDKFTVWDGYAMGKNLELEPGKKIVQSWRANTMEEGKSSTVTFELFPDKKGTKLVFTHEGLTEEEAKEFADGWQEYYWKPMLQYFNNG